MSAPAEKTSPVVKKTVARLAAVQAVYQNLHNHQPAVLLVDEYLSRRAGMEVEGEALALPDGVLFKDIVLGVEQRMNDLNEMVHAQIGKGAGNSDKEVETLLKAILLCGAYELMKHRDIDFPIIINDYVDITKSFYENNESKLVNAILDNIHKLFQ